MLRVDLAGSLQPAAGGVSSVSIDARSIRELFGKLAERFPRMQQHIDEGVAVSINGEIFRDDWGVEIPEDAEVYLLPRIQGG